MKFGLKIIALFLAVLGGGLLVLPGQVAIADGLNFNGSAVLAGVLPDIPKGKGIRALRRQILCDAIT